MLAKFAFLTTAASLLLPAPAHAFWILGHSSLTQERLDPIISPGKVSSHVHTVVGASNFGPEITNVTLKKSNCTTSPVQADMSDYWAPQLYHQNLDNGTYTLIPIVFVNTYYLQRGGSKDPDAKNITAFPAGLRMMAGDPYRSTYNASNQADIAVNFVCLDYSGTSSQATQFPKSNCPDGLRSQIIFPSCWDGVNLDSEDHKSHMSYPIGTSPDNGDCPDTHPNKLVTLFHEWVFDVGKFDFVSGKNNWVFAMGDETGLGFHADFVNGWDVDVLQDAIDQCTGELFDNVEGCPPFAKSVNRPVASSCTTGRVVDEEIDGPLKALPGCNPIPASANATCPGLSTPAIIGSSSASNSSASAYSVPASTFASSAPASAFTSSASASQFASSAPASAFTSSASASQFASSAPASAFTSAASASASASAFSPSASFSASASASFSASAFALSAPASAPVPSASASASASSASASGTSPAKSTPSKRSLRRHHRRNQGHDVSY